MDFKHLSEEVRQNSLLPFIQKILTLKEAPLIITKFSLYPQPNSVSLLMSWNNHSVVNLNLIACKWDSISYVLSGDINKACLEYSSSPRLCVIITCEIYFISIPEINTQRQRGADVIPIRSFRGSWIPAIRVRSHWSTWTSQHRVRKLERPPKSEKPRIFRDIYIILCSLVWCDAEK